MIGICIGSGVGMKRGTCARGRGASRRRGGGGGWVEGRPRAGGRSTLLIRGDAFAEAPASARRKRKHSAAACIFTEIFVFFKSNLKFGIFHLRM